MDIFTRNFQTGEAIEAVGCKKATFLSWWNRGLLVGSKQDTGGGTPGKHRQLKFNTLLETDIAKNLLDVGCSDARTAFHIAGHVAHFSGAWEENGLPCRLPGVPYHYSHGETILAVAGPLHTEEIQTSGRDAFSLIDNRLGHPSGFISLNISRVFGRLCTALGYDPKEVQDFMYGDEIGVLKPGPILPIRQGTATPSQTGIINLVESLAPKKGN